MEDRWRALERAARAGDPEAQASLRSLRARVEPISEVAPGAEVDYQGRVHLVLADPPTSKFLLALRLEDLLLVYTPPDEVLPTGRGYPELLAAIEASRTELQRPGTTIAWGSREWRVGPPAGRRRGLVLYSIRSLDGQRQSRLHGYSVLFWRRRVPGHLIPTAAERRGVVARDELWGEVASLFTSAGNSRVASRNLYRLGERAVRPLVTVLERGLTRREVPDPSRTEIWRSRALEELLPGLDRVAGLIGDLARRGHLLAVLSASEGISPQARGWVDAALCYRSRDYDLDLLARALGGSIPSARSVGAILLKRRGKAALELLRTLGAQGPSPDHRLLGRQLLRELGTLGAWRALCELREAERQQGSS